MQVMPKRVVADSAFQTESWEHFYATKDIQFVALGPYTPWPNRAEAAIRVFKKHLNQILADLEEDPIRKKTTVRQILREACWARNVSLTYGGKTPLELAFGRRPPDIVSIENASPGQLTLPNLEADEVVKRVREVALQSYLKTRQCEDLRQDIAAGLKFLGGPLVSVFGIITLKVKILR